MTLFRTFAAQEWPGIEGELRAIIDSAISFLVDQLATGGGIVYTK